MFFSRKIILLFFLCVVLSTVSSCDESFDFEQTDTELCVIKQNDTVHASYYIDANGRLLEHKCILKINDTITTSNQEAKVHGDQVDDPAGPE